MDLSRKIEIGRLFSIYGVLLTDNQRDMVNLYYNLDVSLGEIAEQQGISRQGVRDTLIRSTARLMEYERLLGLEQSKSLERERIKGWLALSEAELRKQLCTYLEELNGF